MIEYIYNIRYKLKRNETLQLYIFSLDIFKIVEKLFLENGYCWGGRIDNTVLSNSLYRIINTCAYIHISEKTLTFSPCEFEQIPPDTVILDNHNVFFLTKYLFINNKPDYKSRKKINRII